MKNKILLQICDKEYSIITEEPEAYVKMLANEITKMINNTAYKNLRTSKIDATIITCLELCDRIHKLTDDNDNMRREIKSYVDEIGRLSKKVTAFERQKSNKNTNTRKSPPESPQKEMLPSKQKAENKKEDVDVSEDAENTENTEEVENVEEIEEIENVEDTHLEEDEKPESVSGFSDIDTHNNVNIKTNVPVYRQF